MPDRPEHRMSAAANDAAVRHHRDGVVVQAADGRIRSFNPSALSVLSMSADQLTGKTSLDPSWAAITSDHQPFPGEQHPAMVALRTGEGVTGVVMGVHTPQGELRWLRVDSYPFEADDGRHVATWFADITEQRTADEALHLAIETLQRAMLPHAPTVPHGVLFAHDYRAASGDHVVGGDFLDIFEIGRGRFGFFVGDVCGHGYEAMAVTALARHTLRTAMLHDLGPAESLVWLHDAILASREQTFCTAVCGVGAVTDTGISITLANAGHPPPLLFRVGCAAEVIKESGQLVGVAEMSPQPAVSTIHLYPGDQLLAFTDGLLDSSRPRRTHAQLAAGLQRFDHPAETLRVLLDEVHQSEGKVSDDTAVLIVGAPAVRLQNAPESTVDFV